MNDNSPLTTPDPAPINGSSSAHKDISLIRLIELKKKGLSFQEVAAIAKSSKQNVQQRLEPFMDAIQHLDAIKEHRADHLTVISHSVLSSLTGEDIQKASAYQRVGMAGLLHNMERLERGQSTANVAYADMGRSVAAAEARKADLMAKLGLSPSDLRDLVFDSADNVNSESPDYVKSPILEDNQ